MYHVRNDLIYLHTAYQTRLINVLQYVIENSTMYERNVLLTDILINV